MLLKDQKIIRFEKPLPKVLALSAAYNNTFVMVRMDKPCQQESIVHFDANGKILYERTYDQIIDTFGQMNDKEVIVLHVSKSKMEIINLEHQTVRSVNHQYLFQDPVNMAIYNFSDSRLFCIQEKGCFNDHRLRLSYYSYDNLEQNSQPVAIYVSKDNEWTYDHAIFKANNHSKILWATPKHEQQITFNFFDLKDNPNGEFKVVRVANHLGAQYKTNNPQIGISSIWETKPNQYLVCATSNKNELKARSKSGVFNNNYRLNAIDGTIRQVNYHFDKVDDDFSYNDQLIYCFGMGNISVYHTFRHEKGEPVSTPIYYVNQELQQIVAQETWFCTCHSCRFYFPGWDGSTVIQGHHDNGDITEITCRSKKIVDPKEISLHFLLHLNQDFDDDLLQDALQLLH